MFTSVIHSYEEVYKCCACFMCQVQKLTSSLQKLQTSSKDTRDTLSAEVIRSIWCLGVKLKYLCVLSI